LAALLFAEADALTKADQSGQRAKLEVERADLADRKILTANRDRVIKRRDLFAADALYTAALAEVQTKGITQKANELVDTHLTKIVTDHFEVERKTLEITHLKIGLARKSGQTKAAFQTNPGTTLTKLTSEILSEGEQRALALAAFLTEIAVTEGAAIVVYLRSVPAISSPDLPAAKPTPASDMPKTMMASFTPCGKQVFEGACASCHSWSGVSLLADEATLTGSRSVNDGSATNVARIVLSGERRQTPHGVVMMPAFGRTYSDAEIAAVANFVVARFGAAVSSLTAKDVAKLRQ
jgi:mono/diheme cytochrome c family protein